MAQTLTLHTQRFHMGKLDFTRIYAEAGAIVINGAALLLLLAPLNMYVPVVQTRDDDIVIIPVTPEKPPQPVIEEPREVEVRQRVTPTLPSITPPRLETTPLPIVDPLPGDIPVDPVQVADASIGRSEAITKPLSGAHLEYEVAPPPSYPVQAVRQMLTGTVTLRVLVDVDGKPLDVQVATSSGHRMLDAAARKQVLAKWRFRPAMQDGHAVQAIGLIPVVFNLDQ